MVRFQCLAISLLSTVAAACENGQKAGEGANASSKATLSSGQAGAEADSTHATINVAALKYAYLSSNRVSFKEAGAASGEVLVLSSDANFCANNNDNALQRNGSYVQVLSPAFTEDVVKFRVADANSNARGYVVQEANINFQLRCFSRQYAGERIGAGQYSVEEKMGQSSVAASLTAAGVTHEFHLPLERCSKDVRLTLPLKEPGGSEGPFYPYCAAVAPAGGDSSDGNRPAAAPTGDAGCD